MCCHGKMHGHRWMRIVGMGLLGLVTAVIFGFIFGFFVMHLWNWLMPTLFGLGMIGFWKAFGLVLLARLLFGGFGHHGPPYHKFKQHHRHHGEWEGWNDTCCGPKGGWREQEDFDEWWLEEGKEGFERYLENRKPKINK